MHNVTRSKDEDINHSLKNHQAGVNDWECRALVANLHVWAERFIREFKLEIGTPALTIEKLRCNVYGHFRCGRNGLGLWNEIAINQTYVELDRYWQVLGTLLHKLIHCEQQSLGIDGQSTKTRHYHNKAFIQKARSLGLIVNRKGHQECAPAPTPFSELLSKYGIEIPMGNGGMLANSVPGPLHAGTSKLKLWVCSCTPRPVRVRVAIQDFQARCLKCGEIFVRES